VIDCDPIFSRDAEGEGVVNCDINNYVGKHAGMTFRDRVDEGGGGLNCVKV